MGNQATNLRPEAISDLVEDTSLTPEEIRKYYKDFMSGLPEGRMSMPLEDFQRAYKEVFPHGNAERFAAHVFDHFDVDASGRLDFREVIQAIGVQLKGNSEEKLSWVFDLYDLDGTGYIEKSELEEICGSQYKLKTRSSPVDESDPTPREMVDYILEKADLNEDGKLSKEEFIRGVVESKTMQRLVTHSLEATHAPFSS